MGIGCLMQNFPLRPIRVSSECCCMTRDHLKRVAQYEQRNVSWSIGIKDKNASKQPRALQKSGHIKKRCGATAPCLQGAIHPYCIRRMKRFRFRFFSSLICNTENFWWKAICNNWPEVRHLFPKRSLLFPLHRLLSSICLVETTVGWRRLGYRPKSCSALQFAPFLKNLISPPSTVCVVV